MNNRSVLEPFITTIIIYSSLFFSTSSCILLVWKAKTIGSGKLSIHTKNRKWYFLSLLHCRNTNPTFNFWGKFGDIAKWFFRFTFFFYFLAKNLLTADILLLCINSKFILKSKLLFWCLRAWNLLETELWEARTSQ